MDGTSGKSSQSASDFAKNLSKNITIPIAMWDERLSSEGSFKITKELNTNVTNRVNKLDKNAAAFILQGAIDYLSN
jgi:putative Holliday junction resolvase